MSSPLGNLLAKTAAGSHSTAHDGAGSAYAAFKL